MRAGWQLNVCGLLRLFHYKGARVCLGASEAQSWHQVFQEYIRKQSWGDRDRRWEGGIWLTCSHVVSLIFNSILISWINDGTTTLILFIKAVGSMQLCVAFSVNPTRETSPQSNPEASRANLSSLERYQHRTGRHSLQVPSSLLGPNRENCLSKWWTRNSGITPRLEWTAPILFLNKFGRSVTAENFNWIQRAHTFKCP